MAFPLSPLVAYQVPCGRLVFPLFFSLCVAGLRGIFPGHPRPPPLLLSGQHNTTSMGAAYPAWDLNPADLAVVSEECRSSFHHPTAPERHPWPGGGAFLGKNPPPSVRFEPLAPGPRPRSTVSDSYAATELP
ncbi:hypothetical protein GEV33_013806 [Tenebrio molitor]|jgi:hypothetical protein|uniref:Uncharacterized protein n=1 Tax=Tenebrio molitor TaxID=7067 RepID=A0A8J6LDH7_TENMO|nr:hypothetical protein GEV33_013806 [Tenebrio molitor]